ncbi:MAG: hypothetical protein HY040_19440 [Planctomycetes bacterium]|nr:hypothetical protein [Planctomycetota bacterium]
MPIRFRCAYCNQLMGIARRKAGTVVHCPKCKGQVVVPSPEDAPSSENNPLAFGSANLAAAHGGAAPEAGVVFERSDFENLFQPVPQNPQMPHPTTLPPGGALPAAAPPVPAQSTPGVEFDRILAAPPKRGILLTPGILALVGVSVVILMGLAFILGMLFGRSGGGA